MGDPKKIRRKYSSSLHPWYRTEIDENRIFRKEYGLNNRTEVLIARSFLKKYKDIAKKLIAASTKQSEVEKKQMLEKLQKLGIISINAGLDDVLKLQLKDVLERRLQSLIFRKGLAHSIKQARQFITHRHIMVGPKERTSPSYLVTIEEENMLSFKGNSPFADEAHAERVVVASKRGEAQEKRKAEQDAQQHGRRDNRKKNNRNNNDNKRSFSKKPAPKTKETKQ